MYKAVTLAGGIREPLLTCSSFIYIADSSSRYESTDTWDIDFVSSHNSDINFTCVVTFLVGPVETPVHGVKTCSTC